MGNEWEYQVVNAFKSYFNDSGVNGDAIRLPQRMFNNQGPDVIIFYPDLSVVCGIEAKSLSGRATQALYFSNHMRQHKDDGQVTGIQDWLSSKTFYAALAVQIRNGKGRLAEAYLIPWREVFATWKRGRKGIKFEEIREYPRFGHTGRDYWATDEMYDALQTGYYCWG